jgi:hypothetical protein
MVFSCMDNATQKSLRQRHLFSRGITFIEIMVAISVVAIGFAGCWMGLGQCLRVAAAHRETIAATESLMQRVEQTRAAGWGKITSATSIRDQILNTPLGSSAYLSQVNETITVTPYPALTPAPTPIVVTRSADGTVQIVSQPPQGLDLRAILAVRADVQLTWQGSGNRTRTREISTVVALDALLK